MQFTQIPQQYAPLGGELRYAIEQAEAGNIDIRIVEAAADGSGANETAANPTDRNAGNVAGTGSDGSGTDNYARDGSGENSFGADSTGADGAGANISGQNNTSVNISGTDLFGADSIGTDRAGANSTGADISGTDNYARNGSGENSFGAESTGAAGSGTNGSGANDYALDGSGENSFGADNIGADGAGAGISRADNYSLNGSGADISGPDISGADIYARNGSGTNGKALSAGDGSALLGAKRFAGTASASFDAAPYLRRRVRFTPAAGGTGFRSAAGRTVTAVVEAAATGGAVEAVSPARTFRAGAEAAEAPCLLTSMPLSRLIPEGASDELTLLTDGPCTVTVTALSGDTAVAESYRAAEPGLQIFRLDLRDFPGAESLTVDAGACGAVVYAVIPARQGSVRLAWRSRAGSIEHYTFPVVQTEVVRSVRQQAYGPDGRTAAAAETDRETVLVSAYEGRQVLEALAELTAAPEVWIAGGDTYTPADIATDEAIIRRHGTLSCLEIAVRPKRKIRTLWN